MNSQREREREKEVREREKVERYIHFSTIEWNTKLNNFFSLCSLLFCSHLRRSYIHSKEHSFPFLPTFGVVIYSLFHNFDLCNISVVRERELKKKNTERERERKSGREKTKGERRVRILSEKIIYFIYIFLLARSNIFSEVPSFVWFAWLHFFVLFWFFWNSKGRQEKMVGERKEKKWERKRERKEERKMFPFSLPVFTPPVLFKLMY